MNIKLFNISIAICFSCNCFSGEFNNLDFDSPNVGNLREVEVFPLPGKIKIGTVADLFPGWNVAIDGSRYTGDAVFLTGFSDIPVLGSSRYKYSVYYNPTPFSGPNGHAHRFAISQVGLVPSWASDLVMYGSLLLYVNDTLASSHPNGNYFNEYSWDVSQYAGREVKLEVRNYIGTDAGLLDFDIIGFIAPEPSEWALMLAGGCTLLWFGNRTRGRK